MLADGLCAYSLLVSASTWTRVLIVAHFVYGVVTCHIMLYVQSKPVLVRIETPSSSTKNLADMSIVELADVYSFIAFHTGASCS